MDFLIIGGTRNLGHLLTLRLLQEGHRVTVCNRCQTPDELPAEVERLRADRSDAASLSLALTGRAFDVVVDTTLYNGPDAQEIAELLQDRVGHYVFLSTGQVYLVRQGLPRPFVETDYPGPVMPAPKPDSRDYEDWRYGLEKRAAEDVLTRAWREHGFPCTTLRLPMVNSERDHFHRILNYLLRLQDGGPILLPSDGQLFLRHVYGEDVIQAILKVIQSGPGQGRCYNISQEETLTIAAFLDRLAQLARCKLRPVFLKRELLDQHNLLPACSAFSDPWMSELDNRLSKSKLGLRYTPLDVYLEKLVAYYRTHPQPTPSGYLQRSVELQLARHA